MQKYILLCFLLILPTALYASYYESYELTPTDSDTLLKLNEALKHLDVIPLSTEHDGGIEVFGANQIFVSPDFSKMISFKFDVKGQFALNEWDDLTSGSVYHFKSDGKINAVFIKGFSKNTVLKIIDKFKTQTFSKSGFKFSLISSAQASECNTSIAENKYPFFENVSQSVIFQSVLGCATGAKNGAYDATIGSVARLGSMAWNGLKSIGESASSIFTTPGQNLDSYYNGLVKGVGTAKDIIMFAARMAVNPVAAKLAFRNAYGVAAEKIINIFESLKDLPAPVQVEITCSILTGVGIDVLIAYLTVGTGSAKLALTMARFTEQSKILNKIYQALAKIYQTGDDAIKLSKEKLQRLTRKMMENKIPEGDLKFIDKLLGISKKDDKFGLETLHCYIE